MLNQMFILLMFFSMLFLPLTFQLSNVPAVKIYQNYFWDFDSSYSFNCLLMSKYDKKRAKFGLYTSEKHVEVTLFTTISALFAS